MGYKKPIPIEKEKIKIGEQYYTCGWSGVIKVTVVRVFLDTNTVLVKTKGEKCKPFVRSINYIFDDSIMAKFAGRSWEHDERIRKKII